MADIGDPGNSRRDRRDRPLWDRGRSLLDRVAAKKQERAESPRQGPIQGVVTSAGERQTVNRLARGRLLLSDYQRPAATTHADGILYVGPVAVLNIPCLRPGLAYPQGRPRLILSAVNGPGRLFERAE